jgi:pimeloyl-ACP methyl ester carboxylesterase
MQPAREMRTPVLASRLGLLSGLLLFACDSEPGSGSGSGAIEFGECPSALLGVTEGRDCASVSVPARWEAEGSRSIELMVIRYKAAAPSRGQLWLLDGGPGYSGVNFMIPGVHEYFVALGYDVFIPQHRGTGFSTPLTCANPEDLKACGTELVKEWGSDLQGFHSVEAGRDVGHLVERLRQEEEPVYVHGGSYGSYWAQRYLQAYPNQASGVLLSGAVPLREGKLWEADAPADTAARGLFTECESQPACHAAHGGDPEALALRVLAAAEDPGQRCLGEAGMDRSQVSTLLGLAVDTELYALVPALLRRLDRCSEQDRRELAQFNAWLAESMSGFEEQGKGAEALGVHNSVLANHVSRTDLYALLESVPQSLFAERDARVFRSTADSLEGIQALVEAWPVTYPPAPAELPARHSPLLLMSGALDLRTPAVWARALAEREQAPHVEFPRVGHSLDVAQSAVSGQTALPCSFSIMQAFMAEPAAKLDVKCASATPALDLSGEQKGTRARAQAVFGTERLLGEE